MRRQSLILGLIFVMSLVVSVSGAQAIVVNDTNLGGTTAGVSIVPNERSAGLPSGVTAVTSGGPCTDPMISSDLWYLGQANRLPDNALCYHGGSVMHKNEAFALTWDAQRTYWAGARGYLEQFLRDVADGSGTLTSPYALTGQYSDTGGHAANASVYGGGCIDFGSVGGSACEYGASSQAGHDFGASGCPVTGQSFTSPGVFGPNHACLTDAQVQGEVSTMVTQTGIVGRTEPGYTPLVAVLLPAGVSVCLDGQGELCSANSAPPGPQVFCSYHSQVNVGGTEVAYVVQPWTVGTGCDDPSVPPWPQNPSPQQLSLGAGQRLASPLSQGQIAAIVNPGLNGWSALDGSETSENGCMPLGNNLDAAPVGTGTYYLQREFNNAGTIEFEPNTYFGCAPNVLLGPAFVVPSSINQGDEVQLDGSATASTLIVPNAGYSWNFGDGTTGSGPSVVHAFGSAGNYTIKLTVTDRGGNVNTLSQTIQVLGPGGQPVNSGTGTSTGTGTKTNRHPNFQVHILLLPQGLKTVLREGLMARVSSNQRAAGIATVSISRREAKRAHIKVGRGPTVVIGVGTLAGVKDGTVRLHLRMSRTIATKLKRLGHVTLTVRLQLVGANGEHVAIDAAGRY